MNSTKSPYIDKGQANIKYYSSEKAQKKAEENKLKNRKKCKLDRFPKLRNAVVELLKEKNMEYSPDVIANLSKQGKIKGAETTIGKDAIYRAVKQRKYKFSDEVEQFVLRISQADISAYNIFSILTNSELDYGYAISTTNKKIKINPSNRNQLLLNKDESIRKTTQIN